MDDSHTHEFADIPPSPFSIGGDLWEDGREEEDIVVMDEEELLALEGGEGPGTTYLPLGRVKAIVKLDKRVKRVPDLTIQTIAAATELFIASLSQEAFQYTVRGDRVRLTAEDVHTAIRHSESYLFLRPPPVYG
uniref:Core Histone H2A/H2B/H3 domain-containing protein n=1 Tax=Palpitomonas bilix TaxID=652834 RepID=A0A7S3DGJ6_9EUKA|mmetsp:Transcript_36200/g.94157  ORF Transcript_36200/g.94157 Transcript_36200/m.94157 type:complete len:134 (+) Transcript_36200:52-453(+)